MKYDLFITNKFKKSLKKMKKRGFNLETLNYVVTKLQKGEKLDLKFNDHLLHGNWEGFRECHIYPDWLLIYLIEDNILTLTLVDTGTHSDLFKK